MSIEWVLSGQYVPFHVLFFSEGLECGGLLGEILQFLGGKITFDPSSINVFQQSGCYFQAFQEIYIGKDCWIGQNTGIITANHDYFNPDLHQVGKKVVVGDKTWIGMNCLILPGVVLGPNTVVGGGSVVTKSFPHGHCIIAGNPARLIKNLDG